MFFFLPGMALRYLEKPKRQKERGRLGGGGGAILISMFGY